LLVRLWNQTKPVRVNDYATKGEIIMTRGEKVCAFIEQYCLIPEGAQVGQPIKLMNFQKQFILDVYDNPHGTRRAYLSVASATATSKRIRVQLICMNFLS